MAFGEICKVGSVDGPEGASNSPEDRSEIGMELNGRGIVKSI